MTTPYFRNTYLDILEFLFFNGINIDTITIVVEIMIIMILLE